MSNKQHYQCVVIGTGQGGKPLSIALAKSGRKIAVIEREAAGGSCVNFGCTPTKTMAASARIAYLARRASDYGVHAGTVTVNMVEVRKRKQTLVDSFRTGIEQGLEKTDGLDFLKGSARFVGPREIEVNMKSGEVRRLSADLVFINTGVRPALPPVEGLDKVPVLNSTSVMELNEVPEHLLVVGGSYIGLEFGQMFRRFGSKVTIVELEKQLLPREDADVAEEVTKILQQDGIRVLVQTKLLSVEQTNGQFNLKVSGPKGEETLTGSDLLVAAGQIPNTDDLDLEAAGVEKDKKGYIKVNERLETNRPGVYAIGDVKGGPAFTHISYDDYRILRTNLLEGGNATINDRLVPYVVYIDPQLARVGLSESEARETGRSIRVAKLPMSRVARALEVAEPRGFMKAVVDAKTEQILGCAILGIEGGELMSMIEIAMMGKLPYTALREGIFAHPTLAEALNNLFMAMQK